ncbi:uncharacterized protein BX663DRAFT_526627 [Cokeromyces recurvatus]|uniref:uncharacterized protein n=1 Tax=Cokeromyces recurvatus TaxID=90255 RepID=UPI00221EA723|nr:uncharacterized protein BX663DRAFT_526627 [Cokeromyces recurvatus]KAI7897969.1 hypothetical protein BX663DRAFT_526627 [Cokeromyces recurvatus]
MSIAMESITQHLSKTIMTTTHILVQATSTSLLLANPSITTSIQGIISSYTLQNQAYSDSTISPDLQQSWNEIDKPSPISSKQTILSENHLDMTTTTKLVSSSSSSTLAATSSICKIFYTDKVDASSHICNNNIDSNQSSDSSTIDNHSLSNVQITGIVIGLIMIFFVIVVFCCLFLWLRKKQLKANQRVTSFIFNGNSTNNANIQTNMTSSYNTGYDSHYQSIRNSELINTNNNIEKGWIDTIPKFNHYDNSNYSSSLSGICPTTITTHSVSSCHHIKQDNTDNRNTGRNKFSSLKANTNTSLRALDNNNTTTEASSKKFHSDRYSSPSTYISQLPKQMKHVSSSTQHSHNIVSIHYNKKPFSTSDNHNESLPILYRNQYRPLLHDSVLFHNNMYHHIKAENAFNKY